MRINWSVLFIFERLSKTRSIICIKVICGSLWIDCLMLLLELSVNWFMSLRHKPRKLSTYGLLRSFVNVMLLLLLLLHLLLLLWVLVHTCAWQLIWLKSLRMRNWYLISSLDSIWTWPLESISRYLLLWLLLVTTIKNPTFINLN